MVLGAFKSAGANVSHWVCCAEEHRDGNTHYHLAASFEKLHRWNPVREKLRSDYGINVHFSAKTVGYIAAFKYVTKYDAHPLLSPRHPDLQTIKSPRTKLCMNLNKQNAKRRRASSCATATTASAVKVMKSGKPTRLSYPDVAEFLLERDIKCIDVLKSTAMERFQEGEKDLFSFLAKNTDKNVSDLIERTWSTANASKVLEERNKTRMECFEEAGRSRCECDGKWCKMASEILAWNNIDEKSFCEAVYELLTYGRSKDRNMYLYGPANCGKSFLVEPLETIFRCFTNPANNKYAWSDILSAQVLLLNDYRYKNGGPIEWSELLNLLEGGPVKFNRPKNHFATDLILTRENTMPIFATALRGIVYQGASVHQTDREEDDMMDERWKLFKFTHKIDRSNAVKLAACKRCFHNFIMIGSLC